MAQKYKTVLFDADNTLLDFDAAERQALRRTMENRGLPYSAKALADYIQINRSLWDAYHRGEITRAHISKQRFRLFGQTLSVAADAEVWNREYLDYLGDCGDLIPGALETLQALKPYCRIGLATNGLTVVQRKRLKNNPIVPFLDGIFISEEMGVGKPEPAYFQAVLAALGAERETTLMVGDDLLSDIQGAVNAGLDSVWYAPRGGASPLPTWQVAALADVVPIVLGKVLKPGMEA